MVCTDFLGLVDTDTGIIYRETDNEWSNRNCAAYPLTAEEHTVACEGYEAGECTLKPGPTPKNYKLIIKYRWNFDEIPWDEVSDSRCLYNFVKEHSLTELLDSVCLNDVVIYNKAGINPDHRGSDHFLVKMPYAETQVLKSPTLRELVHAVYIAKSHKVDKWYELFHDCKDSYDGIILDFDHGS